MEFIVGIIALAAFAMARNANNSSKEIAARLGAIEASLGLSPPAPELRRSPLAPPISPDDEKADETAAASRAAAPCGVHARRAHVRRRKQVVRCTRLQVIAARAQAAGGAQLAVSGEAPRARRR